MNPRCFQIHPQDNVATLIEDAPAGQVEVMSAAPSEREVSAIESIARGHKIALDAIPADSPVVKFGARIGHATQPIPRGAWVHLHNLASDLDERSATLDLQSGTPTDTSSAYA